MLTIVVLYGGKSTEHKVSVHSAADIVQELKKSYKVLPVYISLNGKWFLQKQCGPQTKNDVEITPLLNGNLVDKKGNIYKVSLYFPVLHGAFGEDGCVQGLFESIGAKYIGCKVLASALAMNKELSKKLAQTVDIPVFPWFTLRKAEKLNKQDIFKRAKKLGYPIFVKPVSFGSSIGVTRVDKESEILAAIKTAFTFENSILVEKGLDNAREVFCGVLETKPNNFLASACGELIKSNSVFFDYETKYNNPHGCDMTIPAKLPNKLQEKLRKYTTDFFAALGGNGLARIDFLISQDGKKVYFSEINTMPGMSHSSLYPNLWMAKGVSYKKLLETLIKTIV